MDSRDALLIVSLAGSVVSMCFCLETVRLAKKMVKFLKERK